MTRERKELKNLNKKKYIQMSKIPQTTLFTKNQDSKSSPTYCLSEGGILWISSKLHVTVSEWNERLLQEVVETVLEPHL